MSVAREVKGYMIDVQGTLIDDKQKRPIAGSIETIYKLQKQKTPFVLVTNNTKQDSEKFKTYLHELGYIFDDTQYLDPLMVLDTILPPTSVAAYGTPEFLTLLKERGYRFDFESPKAVLVSIKADFTNDEYAQMIELILGGAKLVGMHETSIYAKNGRRYPGVGAILKMISFATGCEYQVVGKPSVSFYTQALEKLRTQDKSISFETVEMISDDLKGDLSGAKALGMKTSLVLSGKISSIEEVKSIVKNSADIVAKTIGDVLNIGSGDWHELR
ncbi:HAD-IIA family hydrolase [Hydrogenimonas thermophila]|uniref:NagD protein n=1 Tax=Hydrogenimonas thermophila TaxID=223786 RepID=A0A1I5Q2L9_9BACT|nr:HAD-IIA family hydrolase [Hydrogenimonas thermophila]SFP40462.1 NagD protein [Hydrogenimonas thermophila]